MHRIESNIIEINKEIDKIKNKIVDFVKLRDDYLSKRRSIKEDYPVWNHPFHRTPMDWIDLEISYCTKVLREYEKKLENLHKEREWYEIKYYRDLSVDNIKLIIDSDGYIRGIKL